ncbi:PLDc N-terminal domain-containing protein [Microbacterium hominis]|uniref:Cardiolipin synthase N-terminal domain-containing protein n=1 Tax=Microbacterium hominis TaxID=162426 RepID=A0A0B4D7C8_9MICO|nr:PLDc N-terminal domain-containing protein [Microbacterium hominis]KIC60105.1 hypothetical protein RM52_01470 [Microbacterium hominis]
MVVSVWHVLILIAVLGGLALFVGAVVSIASSAATSLEKTLWILATLMFPFMGPIVWFAVGRRSLVADPTRRR